VKASSSIALSLTSLLTASVVAISKPATAAATPPPTWSQAVSGICAHALLFEGSHQIGTHGGAVAVARDIRASTERRLRRIEALGIAPPQERLAARWLRLERRLAAVYASSYLRIYEAIAAATTRRQNARLPRVLGQLLHAPDALRKTTARLERQLHVPDCTGGGATDERP
jgi:hypothetical protein